MGKKAIALDERLYDYLLAVSLREPEVLRQLRQETAAHPQGVMQIAPDQGQLMGLLVELLGVTKALEIGVFTGYSALAVALAMPATGRLIACDISEEFTAIARRYWQLAGVADKIDLRLGPALETLDQLLATGHGNSFDLVFIDADKINYEHYYERSLQLLRPGGLVLIDNVLWSGRVADPQPPGTSTRTLQAFNQKLHGDSRISLAMLPIADGLTLARKRPQASE